MNFFIDVILVVIKITIKYILANFYSKIDIINMLLLVFSIKISIFTIFSMYLPFDPKLTPLVFGKIIGRPRVLYPPGSGELPEPNMKKIKVKK